METRNELHDKRIMFKKFSYKNYLALPLSIQEIIRVEILDAYKKHYYSGTSPQLTVVLVKKETGYRRGLIESIARFDPEIIEMRKIKRGYIIEKKKSHINLEVQKHQKPEPSPVKEKSITDLVVEKMKTSLY